MSTKKLGKLRYYEAGRAYKASRAGIKDDLTFNYLRDAFDDRPSCSISFPKL